MVIAKLFYIFLRMKYVKYIASLFTYESILTYQYRVLPFNDMVNIESHHGFILVTV